MTAKLLLEYASIAGFVLSAAMIGLLVYKRLTREFSAFTLLLAERAIGLGIAVPILFFRSSLGISIPKAYSVYFYTSWAATIVAPILMILVLHSIYAAAMRPLKGLHSIGKMVFRWVGGVSILVSLGVAFGPHLFNSASSATSIVTNIYAQVQQATSVLALCLLLFVCFAIRPLGLTYRSRIFGVTLGVGILAAAELFEAAWFSTTTAHSVYSPIYLVTAFGMCAAEFVWLAYFALPEPERKLILLPTTSPFFFWNRVSEALGDNPGYVAVAGFQPEMLAPAELKVLTAASASARERKRQVEVAQADALATPLPASLFATK
jgi:hypothetical protein